MQESGRVLQHVIAPRTWPSSMGPICLSADAFLRSMQKPSIMSSAHLSGGVSTGVANDHFGALLARGAPPTEDEGGHARASAGGEARGAHAHPSLRHEAGSAKGHSSKGGSPKGGAHKGAHGVPGYAAHATDCGGGRVVSQWCVSGDPFCFSPNYHCCSSSDAFCPGRTSLPDGMYDVPQRPELGVACLVDAANCRAGSGDACDRAHSTCAAFGEALEL